MRKGQNPAKFIQHVHHPAPVTIAIVTYIPFLSGYYKQSLDVLKVSLNSIWENTPRKDPNSDSDLYDLLVFDNASCPEVREFLQEKHEQGLIQFLILSDKNVGKGGAWNIIFQGAPGDVIAYSDSDIYFHSGWLENSLKILNTYPKVGMVTARPFRTQEEYFSGTLEWAQQNSDAILEKGHFQDWETYREHTDSLGMSPEDAKTHYQETNDWRIQYKGTCAYVGAAHFQFASPKAALQSVLPIKMDRPMGQVLTLDGKLNDAGFLRLSTCDPLVKHMGNRLDGIVKQETEIKPRRTSKRLVDFRPIRRSLLWVYNRIFHLYFDN